MEGALRPKHKGRWYTVRAISLRWCIWEMFGFLSISDHERGLWRQKKNFAMALLGLLQHLIILPHILFTYTVTLEHNMTLYYYSIWKKKSEEFEIWNFMQVALTLSLFLLFYFRDLKYTWCTPEGQGNQEKLHFTINPKDCICLKWFLPTTKAPSTVYFL